MNMRGNQKEETMDRRRWCNGRLLGSLSLLGGIASVPAIGQIVQPRSGVAPTVDSGLPAGRCRIFDFFSAFRRLFLIMTRSTLHVKSPQAWVRDSS